MNTIKALIVLVFLLCTQPLQAQWMSINNTGANPDPNAALDISSNSKGLLIPRLTESERLSMSTPANGLLIFQTDGVEGFYFSKNGTWKLLTDADYSTNDADADSTNELELPSAPNSGDMAYWNGNEWVTIAATANDSATLQFISGVPTWVGGVATIPNVKNPITGKIWMDRNLGATQVATGSTDTSSYGDYYQWGRAADGHQVKTSLTTTTLSSSDTPGNSSFIVGTSDWRSPQNTNLWQGTNGINNPCPANYRIPTEAEWNAERLSWNTNNGAGAMASTLKLPQGGYRYYFNGTILNAGNYGYYWSSTISGSSTRIIYFYSSFASISNYSRAYGFAVRCIKDVAATAGSITSLDCSNATNVGVLESNNTATGVSSTIPYAGGNGGIYSAQTLTSTGVSGLTATLNAGSFVNGSGTLTYSITGTPTSAGTASFAITIGGQSCTLNLVVNTPTPTYPSGTIHCNGATAIVEITNPTTGKIWMDRNLGASQAALSSTDAASYGDLYQWGRKSDGHQCRNSATTTTLLNSLDTVGNNYFIVTLNPPDDWVSPQNNSLWQGVNGTNNPCPSGFRVPTDAELDAERLSWSSNDEFGAISSPLKLSLTGYRSSNPGAINADDIDGYYWSSTVSTSYSRLLSFGDANSADIFTDTRASGFAVRCIKD